MEVIKAKLADGGVNERLILISKPVCLIMAHGSDEINGPELGVALIQR